MVGMDSPLKGIILNHTLKWYTTTPKESVKVLKVTMSFYGSYKYKSPSKRRKDWLRKGKFLAQFRGDPILVPIPFLKPGQSPDTLSLGEPVCTAIATALVMQDEQIAERMRQLCHHWDFLAREAGKA